MIFKRHILTMVCMSLLGTVACEQRDPPEPQLLSEDRNMDQTNAIGMAEADRADSRVLVPNSGAQLPEQVELKLLALAELEPTEGYDATGVVSFLETEGQTGVRIIAEFSDLSPGSHGFHIHETGDCSADDASSAGGHFNPGNEPHGSRLDEQRHLGDLGNLEADMNGRIYADFFDRKLAFDGPNSVIGKAMIIHGGEDDLESQPSGNAGDRVSCGIIELHNVQQQQNR